MNSETGKIYVGEHDIQAARRRGEPLEPIGPRVAEMDKAIGCILPRPPNGPYLTTDGRMLRRRERRQMSRGRG